MAAPSLNTELIKYLSLLTPAQKKSVLTLIKSFVSPEIKSGRITIEQYNKEIQEAMAEAAAGDYITQEEFERESATW
jgi:predicted transcriptional regulator